MEDQSASLHDPVAVVAEMEALAREGHPLNLNQGALLAGAYLHLGRVLEANALLAQLCAAEPRSAFLALEHGRALERCGQRAEARIELQRAVALDPDLVDARLALAANFGGGWTPAQQQAAIEQYEEVVARRPAQLDAWYQLAALAFGAGHFEKAERAMLRTVELNPAHAEAWYSLFSLYQNMDRPQDAVAALMRCVELDPGNARRKDQLVQLRGAGEKKRRPLARFPKKVDEFADYARVLERYLLPELDGIAEFIDEASTILTTGSCFATNIALALGALGVKAHHVTQAEDLNNTYANRLLFEWIFGEANGYEKEFDSAMGEVERQRLRETAINAKALIYSLGVAPVFFDRQTGRPVLTIGSEHNLALQSERTVFRTTTVSENVENMRAMERLVRTYNPAVMFVVTVSPVPLAATQEHRSAIVADCISKTTLRVAAEEFLRSVSGPAFYWPSFEAVRWVAGYRGDAFGAEDGSPRHVSEAIVDGIMRAFINRFGSDAIRDRAANLSGRITEPSRGEIRGSFSGSF